VLAAYAVAMALTLVYTGEHYVVDVLAGWLVAVAAVAAGAVLRRRLGWGRSARLART
jgi:membrane-associated phospholipid phosphatase